MLTFQILGLIGLIVWIVFAYGRVKQTTLVHVWGWGLLAVIGLLGSLLLNGDGRESSSTSTLSFAAWSLTFCPAITLLGIKKPQHIGWHAVTAALWGILILPAAEAWLLRPGQPIELGGLRPWFLLALILLSPVSYLAGRYFFPALVLAIAQGLFFVKELPWGNELAPLFARGGSPFYWLFAAAVLAELQYWREYPADNGLDRVWLDFRDSFGLFWGLRVAERVNAAAVLIAWPFRLEWWGVMPITAEHTELSPADTAEIPAELRTAVRGLLRRFVTHDWLESRWSGKSETAAQTSG